MKLATIVGGVFVLILFALGYYFFGSSRPAAKNATITVAGQIFRVEVADTPAARGKGLSGRPGLAEDEGMLFVFDTPGRYGFWMKDMRFPIDIVWISGDKVVGFSENVPPEPGKSAFELKIYYPPEAVDRVLEVKAGTVARLGLKVGDLIYSKI